MAKTGTTVTVKNICKGDRVLNSSHGPVSLAPNEVIEDLEMEDHEIEVAKDTGWFDFEASAPEADPDEDPGLVDEPEEGADAKPASRKKAPRRRRGK